MIRYAVEVVGVGHSARNIYWVSIGTGMSTDPQNAHLYSYRDLAEKKLTHYVDHPEWYHSARIVEVEVTGL